MKWANPEFDDSDWERIRVPSTWEDQGFYGYDGYAWYRTRVYIKSSYKGKSMSLFLGRVDDVDEVYFNGKLIGSSGKFPPDYQTAYYVWRQYVLPEEDINFGDENTIAVRVYDSELGGGIVEGDQGIYEDEDALWLDVDLRGNWKFEIGDNKDWRDPNYNDSDWGKIGVPAYWEAQGYKDYDGFAWYRIQFKIPYWLEKKDLILLLGKIDDIDQTYFNGKLIGSVGKFYDDASRIHFKDEYSKLRYYYIPHDLIHFNGENTIAVRVYDGYKDGGIYEGPIGITTNSKFSTYMRNRGKTKNWFERFLEDVFDDN